VAESRNPVYAFVGLLFFARFAWLLYGTGVRHAWHCLSAACQAAQRNIYLLPKMFTTLLAGNSCCYLAVFWPGGAFGAASRSVCQSVSQLDCFGQEQIGRKGLKREKRRGERVFFSMTTTVIASLSLTHTYSRTHGQTDCPRVSQTRACKSEVRSLRVRVRQENSWRVLARCQKNGKVEKEMKLQQLSRAASMAF
jgi:hypothetical protein